MTSTTSERTVSLPEAVRDLRDQSVKVGDRVLITKTWLDSNKEDVGKFGQVTYLAKATGETTRVHVDTGGTFNKVASGWVIIGLKPRKGGNVLVMPDGTVETVTHVFADDNIDTVDADGDEHIVIGADRVVVLPEGFSASPSFKIGDKVTVNSDCLGIAAENEVFELLEFTGGQWRIESTDDISTIIHRREVQLTKAPASPVAKFKEGQIVTLLPNARTHDDGGVYFASGVTEVLVKRAPTTYSPDYYVASAAGKGQYVGEKFLAERKIEKGAVYELPKMPVGVYFSSKVTQVKAAESHSDSVYFKGHNADTSMGQYVKPSDVGFKVEPIVFKKGDRVKFRTTRYSNPDRREGTGTVVVVHPMVPGSASYGVRIDGTDGGEWSYLASEVTEASGDWEPKGAKLVTVDGAHYAHVEGKGWCPVDTGAADSWYWVSEPDTVVKVLA